MKIMEKALAEGQSTLSEYESKQILSSYGIPITNVGRICLENEQVKEIDINPVIIFESGPVAVDALVVLE